MLSNSKKISMRQAVFLFMTVVFTPSTRLVPAYVSKYAKQAAWLSSIATFVLLVLLIQVWQVLYRKYNDKSPMDIYCDTAGTAAEKSRSHTCCGSGAYRPKTGILPSGLSVRYTERGYKDIYHFVLTSLLYAPGLTTMAVQRIVFPSLIVVFLLLILMMIPPQDGFLTPVSYRSILPVLSQHKPMGIVAYFSFMFIFGDRINNKRTSANVYQAGSITASWK